MTLMKSILLGSAAGIVAVASAQAADLPTRKAAPAEFVKVCNVAGMAGFIIPGSDTCLKLSGYVTAQVEGGNTKTGYSWTTSPAVAAHFALDPKTGAVTAVAAKAAVVRGQKLVAKNKSLNANFGWTNRANIDFDARTMTSYGPLRAYAELQFENGNGFDTTGVGAYINLAYVQWAGITAGKAPSFFSFFGGGEGWANIFSPDQIGFNQPDVLAYTATFGGGFSATLALQSAGANSPAFNNGNWGASGGGTNMNINTTTYGGSQFGGAGQPDVVANVRVDQSWGAAQLSGVAHHVDVYDTAMGPNAKGSGLNTWGYAIGAGVSFNLPMFGAADKLQLQGDYSKNAVWYSGIPDAMWGENGATNGNGLAMSVGDTYHAVAAKKAVWATPTAWSIGATFEHHFSPAFSLDPEAAYAQLNWGNSLGQLSSNSTSYIAGAVAHWDPVVNLDFALELLYQNTHQSTPGDWTKVSTIDGKKAAFPGSTDGFAGRFYITRNF